MKLCATLLLLLVCSVFIVRAQSSEVEKVAVDRPQLLEVIDRGSPIWLWLDQHFKNTNGLPAIWSPEYPNLPNHYYSAHRFNQTGQAIVMVIDKRPDGSQVGGEEFLSMLVYELINASNRDSFRRLNILALEHKIGRDAYMKEMARLEHGASLALKQFRVDYWTPNAVQKHLKWDNPYWKQGTCEDFDTYYRMALALHEGYPEDAFGARYDALYRRGIERGFQATNPVPPSTSPVPTAIETNAAPTPPSLPVTNSVPQADSQTSSTVQSIAPPSSPPAPTTNAPTTSVPPLDLTTLVPAAQAGDLVAEHKLIDAYAKGEGLPQDYDQGFIWASEAAFQGDIQGESALGWLYSNGKGVHRNESKAFAWYLKAAQQGDATAERCVGCRYQSGTGAPRNDGLAVPWLHKATAQGESMAKDLYGTALLNGQGVTKDYQKGFTYVLSSACDLYVPAYLIVALCYNQGAFVARDPVQAYRWCLLGNQKDSRVLTLEQTLKKQLTDDQIKKAESANEDWIKMMKGEIQPGTLVAALAKGSSVTLPFKKAVGHIRRARPHG